MYVIIHTVQKVRIIGTLRRILNVDALLVLWGLVKRINYKSQWAFVAVFERNRYMNVQVVWSFFKTFRSFQKEVLN